MDNRLYIPRKAEQLILRWLNIFPAVVIIGPRQVGKTSLTQSIRNQAARLSLYLDLEREEDLSAVNRLEAFAEANLDRLIILDEIQRKPDLFPQLRSVIDRNREAGRFILLGSASLALIRDASESLAGRIGIIELPGLSVEEVAGAVNTNTHWLRGGFPNAVLAKTDEDAYDWLRNFIRTYLERDLPAYGLSLDTPLVSKLFTMLAHLTGSQLNVQQLGRNLQLDTRTVNRCLNFLEETFLVRRLQPYFINIGKRLVKSPKIYLRDTGVLHALLRIKSINQLFSHPIIGASFEAFVIEQVAAMAGEEYDLYYYRTQNGAEIDLVIEAAGTIFAVLEIKNADNPKLSRGFYNALEDLGHPPAFVVTPSQSANHEFAEGIQLLGVGQLAKLFTQLT